MKQQNWLLTVTGKDRTGIIAEITGILYKQRFNLEDITMTILEGEFAMMLVFCGRTGPKPIAELARLLEHFEKTHGLSCELRPLRGKLKRGDAPHQNVSTYLISAMGRDKTGIVHKISRILAQNRLNITDLNSKILGYGRHCLYTMILEVDVPRSFSLIKLERALRRLQQELKIEIQIKPVETIQL